MGVGPGCERITLFTAGRRGCAADWLVWVRTDWEGVGSWVGVGPGCERITLFTAGRRGCAAGVLAPHPHPARAARQQRPDEDGAEAGQDDRDGAASHLAVALRRGVDQDRGAAEGPHPRRLRQEEQVSSADR